MIFLKTMKHNIPNLYNTELPLSVVSLVDTETVVSIRTDTTSIRFIVCQRVTLNTSSTTTDCRLCDCFFCTVTVSLCLLFVLTIEQLL